MELAIADRVAIFRAIGHVEPMSGWTVCKSNTSCCRKRVHCIPMAVAMRSVRVAGLRARRG